MDLRKTSISEFTENEFLIFLREFFEDTNGLRGVALELYICQIADYFARITEHPRGSDLIFYPARGAENSPKGVLREVRRWRAANGLPGFKPIEQGNAEGVARWCSWLLE